MSDPLSITAAVFSLAAASWKIGSNLKVLRNKFQRAPETMSGLVTEFDATTAGLGQLQALFRTTDILRTEAGEDARNHAMQCLDAIIVDMAQTFSRLNVELDKLGKGETLTLALRMRFLFVESDLVEYMTRIRDQRSALSFVLHSIQMAKLEDIRRQFQSDSLGLSALKRTATKAKQCRWSASSFSAPHPEATNDPERLDLDSILRRDMPFPDLDSMATNPKDTTTLPPRQSEGKIPAAVQAEAATCPPPSTSNMKRPQGAPTPAPATTPRKVTPTIVFHDLHNSVSTNDVSRVCALLDFKHDPLGLPHDPYGCLPNAKKSSLALAAYLGREEIMLIFLQRGFAWALNQLIGTDLPPLAAAAYAGHERMVQLLLSWRADPRLRGAGDNTTALFWASSRGHASIVNLLLTTTASADINSPNSKGLTPLMVASQHGRTEVTRILLSHGADQSILNAKGQSALHLACHAGNSAVIGLLLAQQDAGTSGMINAVTSNGKTPLIFAAISGHADACDILLAAGTVLVEAQDCEGKTALYHASCHGFGEVVEVLLGRGGAKTGTLSNQGDNALHIACERGHARAVGALLAHGATLETPRASDDMSALQIAMWYQRRGILAPLILFQTQQDPVKFTKEMALYSAAEWGLGETMDALLEAGADINGNHNNNHNNESDATGGQTLLARAVWEGKPAAVAWLLKKGAEVDKVDRFGAAPLHRAAKGGNLRVAEFLLKAGADMESRDQKGLAPLHVAAVYGTKEMVELLVQHGSRVDALSAVEASTTQKGAGEQRTALGMAAENRRKDVVEKLLGLGALPTPGEMVPYKLQGDRSFVVDAEGKTEITFIISDLEP
ncbi:ankyrin-1 [Echria macrotheca]|uniref:Ankyrin-1 n=1 Tax=Echria macrotheca TaxID=438768 RepID=A0AAJ0B3P2_9PEZI|nr:ankyrin-1 [Echria macrotheca]